VFADYQQSLMFPTKFNMVVATPLEILFKGYNSVVITYTCTKLYTDRLTFHDLPDSCIVQICL